MKPEIGKIIRDGERRRDAVHMALAPVQAAEDLLPASHVGFVGNSIHLVGVTGEPIGAAASSCPVTITARARPPSQYPKTAINFERNNIIRFPPNYAAYRP